VRAVLRLMNRCMALYWVLPTLWNVWSVLALVQEAIYTMYQLCVLHTLPAVRVKLPSSWPSPGPGHRPCMEPSSLIIDFDNQRASAPCPVSRLSCSLPVV